MATIIQMCTTKHLSTLLELDIMRRPRVARKLGFSHLVEAPKPDTTISLNYKDTAAAKMEMERQPRRTARMNKLKLNVISE